MNAQEKAEQIAGTVRAIEGDPITEEIEYRVLAGQGIEYPVGDKTLLLPAMTVRQYGEMIEFEKKCTVEAEKPKGDCLKVLDLQVEFIAKMSGYKKDELKDLLTSDDIGRILALLMYGWLEGRRILKKNSIPFSAVSARINILRIAKV